MKKYFYLLTLLLPLGFMAAACDDDDDDAPDIGIQATITGGVIDGNEIYVTQGDELTIDALILVNRTDKEGALGAVTYYWDYIPVGTVITQPFTLHMDTADQPVGRHLLQADMPIYIVDYPIYWGYLEYYVNIVEAKEDLPDDGDDSASHIVTGVIKEKK